MNGLLLVVIGLLLLFIGITGKFECFSTFFNCVAFGQDTTATTAGSAGNKLLGGIVQRLPGSIGGIIHKIPGNTGVTGGLII